MMWIAVSCRRRRRTTNWPHFAGVSIDDLVEERSAYYDHAGFLRGGLLEMTQQSRSMIQEQLRKRMAKREALTGSGVMASDIVMLEPDQYLPITQHLIVIATETAPRGITFPAIPYNGGPLRSATGPNDNGPAQPTRVFNEKTQDGTESVEVEVKVWDAEHRKWLSEGTTMVKIGPKGVEEGGAEITALVEKARARGHGVRSFEFEFALKGSAAIKAGEKTEWEAKVKKAITIKLPSGVKLEGSVSIDQHGVPGLGMKVVLP